MIVLIIRLLLAVAFAFVLGKLVSKVKLPAILGWLLAGMILGPHAVGVMSQQLLNAPWYENMLHIFECAVGLMIGTELVFSKLKKSGKQIVLTTLSQSLGTFATVSACFGAIFYFTGTPLYVAFVFGGIALATAPAPALSIVKEFHTDGPVTKTLIPMAALDDIVGIVVFFTVISLVGASGGDQSTPLYQTLLTMILLPLLIGVAVGFFAGLVLKKERSANQTLGLLIALILAASAVGLVCNALLPQPVLNFMLIGMAFSATFSNMVQNHRLEQIMSGFNPILGACMIVVILNLGAPLDYHFIMGAGIFTAVYIVSRALGKYFGAYLGAKATHCPQTVQKYLGLTLLPHSGVSLVFTGIAVTTILPFDPASAAVIQGTIAAAAVINEVVAVIVSKKAFEWSGEMGKALQPLPQNDHPNATVITISRQYGSGGREIGRRLAKELGIALYDREIIMQATTDSSLPPAYFESPEDTGADSLLYSLATGVSHHEPLGDQVFAKQSQTILSLASQGSCIFVGRCADTVLQNKVPLLSVFVQADTKVRTQRIVEQYHKPAANAPDLIAKTDRRRESYYKFYTKKNLGDAKNYDICLNSGTLGIDGCVAVIKQLYLQTINQD